MVSLAEIMQEAVNCRKTGKGNKENLTTVNVLAVVTTLIRTVRSDQRITKPTGHVLY